MQKQWWKKIVLNDKMSKKTLTWITIESGNDINLDDETESYLYVY